MTIVCPNAGGTIWCSGCLHSEPHDGERECTDWEESDWDGDSDPCLAPCVEVENE